MNIFLRNEQRRECDVVVFWKIYFLIILIFSQLSKQTLSSYINVVCVCVFTVSLRKRVLTKLSKHLHYILHVCSMFCPCPWQRLGNQELVRNVDQLWWFGHTYKHRQPHTMTSSGLYASMEQNRQFAKVLLSLSLSLSLSVLGPTHMGRRPAICAYWADNAQVHVVQ